MEKLLYYFIHSSSDVFIKLNPIQACWLHAVTAPL